MLLLNWRWWSTACRRLLKTASSYSSTVRCPTIMYTATGSWSLRLSVWLSVCSLSFKQCCWLWYGADTESPPSLPVFSVSEDASSNLFADLSIKHIGWISCFLISFKHCVHYYQKFYHNWSSNFQNFIIYKSIFILLHQCNNCIASEFYKIRGRKN